MINKLDHRHTTILRHASLQFQRIANYADDVAERDNYVTCAPWDMISGNDYSQSLATRTATYKMLNNGNVEARFRPWSNSMTNVVQFEFIKENGKLKISDIYSDGNSFLLMTIDCLEEFEYL